MDEDAPEGGEDLGHFGLVLVVVGELLKGGRDTRVEERLPLLEPGQVPRGFAATDLDIVEDSVDRLNQDLQALMLRVPEDLKS